MCASGGLSRRPRARQAPQAPPPRAAASSSAPRRISRGRSTWSARHARRLRPLKRQAEAADLHERLERQTLEARYALSQDAARAARAALAEAEERAVTTRAERDEAERLLAEVARRREQAEDLAAQSRARELRRAYAAPLRGCGRHAARAHPRAAAAAGGATPTPARAARAAGGGGRRVGRGRGGPGRAADRSDREGARARAGRSRSASGASSPLRSTRFGARGGCEDRGGRCRPARRAGRGRGRGRRRRARPAEQAERTAEAAGPPRHDWDQDWPGRPVRTRRGFAFRATPGRLPRPCTSEPGYELALAAVLGPRLTAGADLAAGERLLEEPAPGQRRQRPRRERVVGPRQYL